MKITYKDLHSLVDDFKYLVQKGGSPFVQTGGGSIWDRLMKLDSILKSILTLIVMLVVFFILYRFVFKGYPKVVMDIFTMSFFKRQDVDSFLADKNFFYGNYRRTLDPFVDSMDGYDMLADILGTSEDLKDKLKYLDQCISTYYSQFNYDARLTEAFKEYYLYFYKIQTNNQVKVYSWIPKKTKEPDFVIPQMRSPDAYVSGSQKMTDVAAPEHMIPYYSFYESLYEYRKRRGLLTEKDYIIYGGKVIDKKNDKDMIITTYARDSAGMTSHFKRVSTMHRAISDVANALKNIMTLLTKYPITLYLVIPPNKSNSDMQGNFRRDYDIHKASITSGAVYDRTFKFTNMDEFSWYIVETIAHSDNKYVNLSKQLEELMGPSPSSNLIMFLRSYMNVPFAQRLTAAAKIKLNYKDLANMPSEILSFANKHPIFTRIYLNTEMLSDDKADFYDMVIRTYKVLMDTHYSTGKPSVDYAEKIENLCKNGQAFLLLMNNLIVLDLYINVYQDALTKLYEEEFISNRMFFRALWTPFFNELWHQRIMEYYKRVFSSAYIRSSRTRFNLLWSKVGQMIYNSRSSISAKFKQNLEKPSTGPDISDDAPKQDNSYSG